MIMDEDVDMPFRQDVYNVTIEKDRDALAQDLAKEVRLGRDTRRKGGQLAILHHANRILRKMKLMVNAVTDFSKFVLRKLGRKAYTLVRDSGQDISDALLGPDVEDKGQPTQLTLLHVNTAEKHVAVDNRFFEASVHAEAVVGDAKITGDAQAAGVGADIEQLFVYLLTLPGVRECWWDGEAGTFKRGDGIGVSEEGVDGVAILNFLSSLDAFPMHRHVTHCVLSQLTFACKIDVNVALAAFFCLGCLTFLHACWVLFHVCRFCDFKDAMTELLLKPM